MRTLSDGASIGHDNGCSQIQFHSGARDLVDTPVQAHSIQAASLFSEGKGCSFDTGVHTLSACGGQGEMAAAAHHFIGHDNSRVGAVLRSYRGAAR
jgi:hypothetical protein